MVAQTHIEQMNEVLCKIQAQHSSTSSLESESERDDRETTNDDARDLVRRAVDAIANPAAAAAPPAAEGAPSGGASSATAAAVAHAAADLERLASAIVATPAEALKEHLLGLVQRRARRAAAVPRARLQVALDTPRDGQSSTDAVPEEWRVPLTDLGFVCQIGHGSAGTCYRASMRGTSTVAVKVAHGGSEASWRSELAVLCRLRHPNVVRFLGAVLSPPTFCLVLELYRQRGSDPRAARALASARPSP